VPLYPKFCMYDDSVYEVQTSTVDSPDNTRYTFLKYVYDSPENMALVFLLHGGEPGAENPPHFYTVQSRSALKMIHVLIVPNAQNARTFTARFT